MKKLSEFKYNLKNKTYEALYYGSNVQLIGNRQAIIENCRHIVECNDIMVKVNTYTSVVTIWGRNLSMSDFNKENIVVNGYISSVDIEQKGKKQSDDF